MGHPCLICPARSRADTGGVDYNCTSKKKSNSALKLHLQGYIAIALLYHVLHNCIRATRSLSARTNRWPERPQTLSTAERAGGNGGLATPDARGPNPGPRLSLSILSFGAVDATAFSPDAAVLSCFESGQR